jgi:hypothetical protein
METKDVKIWLSELLTAEAWKGHPQPIEQRKEKGWKTSRKPV